MSPVFLLLALLVPVPEHVTASKTIAVTGELHYRSMCVSGQSNPATTRRNSLDGPFVYLVDAEGAFVGNPVTVEDGKFTAPGIQEPGLYFLKLIYQDRPWFVSGDARNDMVGFEVKDMKQTVSVSPLCVEADHEPILPYFATRITNEPDIIVQMVTREGAAADLEEPELTYLDTGMPDKLEVLVELENVHTVGLKASSARD